MTSDDYCSECDYYYEEYDTWTECEDEHCWVDKGYSEQYIHPELLPCKRVEVLQTCEDSYCFSESMCIKHKGIMYGIEISQKNHVRTCIVSRGSGGNAEELFRVFEGIEKYIMLVEGKFLEMRQLSLFYDNFSDVLCEAASKNLLDRRLPYFSTRFTPFYELDLSFTHEIDVYLKKPEPIEKWLDLCSKWRFHHNAFLYNTMESYLPIDERCGRLLEACKWIVTLFGRSISNNVEECIHIIMSKNTYHFTEEMGAYCLGGWCRYTRNRYAHYNDDRRYCLSTRDSVIVLTKLFLVYRIDVLWYCTGKTIYTAHHYRETKDAIMLWCKNNVKRGCGYYGTYFYK